MRRMISSWITGGVDRIPLGAYCALVNLRCILRGKAHRISRPSDSTFIYRVQSGEDSILLCRRGRHNMHKRGIQSRVDALAKNYCLSTISDLDHGTLIDCGANVGELGLWASGKGLTYIAFEPETLEADCCDLNNFSGRRETNRFPLWKTDETLRFYNRPRDADGSVLPSGEDHHFIEVQARRLDSVLQADDLARPIIFKVEAEGAEPEVLEGARALLPYMDYISVDCSYERGNQTNPQHTLIETNRLLTLAGFEIVAADLRRCSFLFKRQTVPTEHPDMIDVGSSDESHKGEFDVQSS